MEEAVGSGFFPAQPFTSWDEPKPLRTQFPHLESGAYQRTHSQGRREAAVRTCLETCLRYRLPQFPFFVPHL